MAVVYDPDGHTTHSSLFALTGLSLGCIGHMTHSPDVLYCHGLFIETKGLLRAARHVFVVDLANVSLIDAELVKEVLAIRGIA